MESPIIPLGDKIVILPQEEGEQTYGNIVVPDMGKERPEMGTVLAVGPGRISTDGTLIPNRIEVGVTVMVPKFGAQVVVVENETYIVAGESDVLGIIKNKAMGYYGSLESAIKRISKLSLVSEQKDYTLTGFIESYNNIVNKLTKNIKNV